MAEGFTSVVISRPMRWSWEKTGWLVSNIVLGPWNSGLLDLVSCGFCVLTGGGDWRKRTPWDTKYTGVLLAMAVGVEEDFVQLDRDLKGLKTREEATLLSVCE